MYLKNDRIVITIGNVVMRSYKAGTTSQFLLDETALTGWNDGVDVKRASSPRQTSSGDFAEVGYHSSRLITASGLAVAKSIAELKQMRDDLVGAVSPENYVSISVEDATGVRTAVVSSGGKVGWVQQTDTVAAFKIDLYAPDPYIYGYFQTITLGGNATTYGLDMPLVYPLDFGGDTKFQSQFIANRGNQPSWPVFTAKGDFPQGFSISDNLGHVVTYTGAVTLTAPVKVDMRTGVVTQNKSDRSTYVSRRDWFAIPAKGSIQPSFLPVYSNGVGWCDIIYRDTWI